MNDAGEVDPDGLGGVGSKVGTATIIRQSDTEEGSVDVEQTSKTGLLNG